MTLRFSDGMTRTMRVVAITEEIPEGEESADQKASRGW